MDKVIIEIDYECIPDGTQSTFSTNYFTIFKKLINLEKENNYHFMGFDVKIKNIKIQEGDSDV